jgi:DUF971 family protein
MKPHKIRQDPPTELTVEWDDGHRGRHLLTTLRSCCPCAACRAEAEPQEGIIALPVLRPGQNELRSVEPVGAYALQLTWGDGHKTGIYTFDYLRQICECKICRELTAE